MKQKIGICIDCSKNGPIIAHRCQQCYWKYRASLSKEKGSNKLKKAKKEIIGIYMANQTLTMPRHCEESGQELPTSPSWLRRACIAHILPKKSGIGGFSSVATHPQNRVFLHPDVHSNMDNLGSEYVKKMKCLPIMKERVKKMIPDMTQEEKNRIPEWLL